MVMPSVPINVMIKKPHRSNEYIEERKNNEEALQASSDKVKPPTWLSKDAKKIFKKSVNELKEIKLVTNLDVNTLAVYCDNVAKYSNFENELKRLHDLLDDANEIDDVAERIAALRDINKMIINFTNKKLSIGDAIRKYAIEFGLTPQARAKIAIPKVKEKQKTEEEELFSNV